MLAALLNDHDDSIILVLIMNKSDILDKRLVFNALFFSLTGIDLYWSLCQGDKIPSLKGSNQKWTSRGRSTIFNKVGNPITSSRL